MSPYPLTQTATVSAISSGHAAYLPWRGVLVNDRNGKLLVVTSSAALYYTDVSESVKVLSGMGDDEVAEYLSVPRKYAKKLRAQLLSRLRAQLEKARAQEELMVGIVRDASGQYFAIGSKIFTGDDPQKESKALRLRRSLPVGLRVVYRITRDALILPTGKGEGVSGYAKGVPLSEMEPVDAQLVLLLPDTYNLRYNFGLRYAFSRRMWEKTKVLSYSKDPHVMLQQPGGTSTYRVSECDNAILPSFSHGNINLQDTVIELDEVITAEGRVNIAMIVRGNYIGLEEFAEYIKSTVKAGVANVKFYHGESEQAKESVSKLYSLLNGISGIEFKDWLYSTLEVVNDLSNAFYRIIAPGVMVNPERINGFRISRNARVKTVAKLLGVLPSQIFVKAGPKSKPPFLFWSGFRVGMTANSTWPEGVPRAYARPTKNIVIKPDNTVVAFDGNPDLLLAGNPVL